MAEGVVLVADDEESIRVLCRVNLELAGYQVLEAADGPTTIELAKAHRPDVLLLDVMMPGASGWEVLASLRADPDTAHIPVVMLTALQTDEAQLSAWDGGAVEYLTKPFNPMALAEWVERARIPLDDDELERRRQRAVAQVKLVRELRG